MSALSDAIVNPEKATLPGIGTVERHLRRASRSVTRGSAEVRRADQSPSRRHCLWREFRAVAVLLFRQSRRPGAVGDYRHAEQVTDRLVLRHRAALQGWRQ